MKRKLLNLFIAMAVISAFAVVYSFNNATIKENSIAKFSAPVMPDSIMHFFKKTCMDCHSDGGSGMASSIINFSKWDEYTPEKQSSKANKICNVLSEDRMPPTSWRKANPNSVPTKKDADIICNWATSLTPSK